VASLLDLLAQVGFYVFEQPDGFVSREAFANAPADFGMRLPICGVIDSGDQEHRPYVGFFVVPESLFQLPHHVLGDVAHNSSVYRHRSPHN
jgi:hypothetical protein